jgi:uncharacterized OB-fold protein
LVTKQIDWAQVVTEGRIIPAKTPDTEFFWNGLRDHRLLIQRCTSCTLLRHPPGPMCPVCQSVEWDAVESAGRGNLYSYTTVYAPLAPGFTQPAVVGLVALEEGTRIVSNLVDVSPEELEIGMPVEVFFADQAEGWTVPQFRARRP